MNCDKENKLAIHWLNHELSEPERLAFEQHLAHCPDCQKEIEDLQSLLHKMETVDIPAPSSHMDTAFRDMLHAYQRPAIKTSFREKINALFFSQPRVQLVYSILLLALGIAAGYLLFNRPGTGITQVQLTALNNKVEDMRQTMILSLLESQSAGERLKAVSYAQETSTPDLTVIDALFITLNEDPNVNVRLATLETLAQYDENAGIRQRLVQSIALQDSPLMQAALADVMLQFHEKKALNSFKMLLKKQEVPAPVKKKIEKTIQTLQS